MMLRSKIFLTSLFLLISYIFCNAQEPRSFFPKDEYEYYMALIRSINPEVYEKMRRCEIQTGQPCLQKQEGQEGGVPAATILLGTEMSHGYPILIMSSIKDYEYQKHFLKEELDFYNILPIITPITASQKKHILEIIRSLDPSLYNNIVAVDPNGAKHIQTADAVGDVSVFASKKDGLPIFFIDPDYFMKFSIPEQQATLAHELGHYVLVHITDYPVTVFAANKAIEQKEQLKGRKIVSGQLPTEEAFQLAYSRVQEHEADRYSVIDVGVNIDAAISGAQKDMLEEQEQALTEPHKETFKRTHPLWAARIEHLNSLRPEVELQKARNAPRKKIDWQKLAQEYLQWFASKKSEI